MSQYQYWLSVVVVVVSSGGSMLDQNQSKNVTNKTGKRFVSSSFFLYAIPVSLFLFVSVCLLAKAKKSQQWAPIVLVTV